MFHLLTHKTIDFSQSTVVIRVLNYTVSCKYVSTEHKNNKRTRKTFVRICEVFDVQKDLKSNTTTLYPNARLHHIVL